MGKKVSKKDRTTLWMRYVEFERIKDLLLLVYENNGKLRPLELERLGVEKKILVKEDGKPFKHTARYHYRKVMEGLGLVVKDKVYYISQNKRVVKFIKLTEFKKDMSQEAKEILREIIVDNADCKKYFFDVFMKESGYTLKSLRERGSYVVIETESMREVRRNEKIEKNSSTTIKNKKKKVGPVILKNPHGKMIKLEAQDLIQAVYWGVRLWALDLEIIDEILLSFAEGRIMYPINPNFSEEVLLDILVKKMKKDTCDSEWVTIHIPTFIKEASLSTRFSISKIKLFLTNLKSKYPFSTMFISSSTMFIDIKTPFEKQEKAIRKLYLYSKERGFISHLRINKTLLKEVNYG